MIQTSTTFWVVILGYFTLILGFGSYFARYNRTTTDFFFSGRRFSWWLISMSIVATGVGSHSFLKYSAKAYFRLKFKFQIVPQILPYTQLIMV